MGRNETNIIIRFLDRFDKHISHKLLFLHLYRDSSTRFFHKWAEPTGFTGLHGAAFFGIVEIDGGLEQPIANWAKQ